MQPEDFLLADVRAMARMVRRTESRLPNGIREAVGPGSAIVISFPARTGRETHP